ncbi:hypothetical protein KEM07_28395, partial [Pseudomonas carnis]|uniref:hypothetical protein n=1 Tax=Pseudomonas carnis TaxID=2487355 RepID=UPI001C2FAC3F
DWLRLRIRVYQRKVWHKRMAAKFIYAKDVTGLEQKCILLIYHDLAKRSLSLEVYSVTSVLQPIACQMQGKLYRKYVTNIADLLEDLNIDLVKRTLGFENHQIEDLNSVSDAKE